MQFNFAQSSAPFLCFKTLHKSPKSGSPIFWSNLVICPLPLSDDRLPLSLTLALQPYPIHLPYTPFVYPYPLPHPIPLPCTFTLYPALGTGYATHLGYMALSRKMGIVVVIRY